MKLLLLALAALVAAVSSSRLNYQSQPENQPQSPWQVGKLYRYEVNSHTLARLHEGPSTGSAFKAQFIVRVKSPSRLQAMLENPLHAQLQQELPNERELPDDLKYQPVQNLDKPFEINLDGGRVTTLSLPSSVQLAHENLLKGLIGALQVDLSTYRNIHGSQDNYDKEQKQGLFRKMETDVTGDCETLYTVSPVAAEWRRELPRFASEEDPILITKSKNYGHCHHRVAYHFGVPEGAEWTGTAHKPEEEQFIKRATVCRILAGMQGPIYKTETTSTVYVHPHLYGKQKAEVHSYVNLELVSTEQDSEDEWQKPEGSRLIKSLLYSVSSKQIASHDDSSSSSSSESHEYKYGQDEPQPKQRYRRSAKSPKVIAISKVIVKRSDGSRSSDSSSSSSDSSSAYINDEIPQIGQPVYSALYMSPQPHVDKKQNTLNAQKILQDIAQQLQNPSNMPKADFLSKFNVLVRVLAAMSTEQLSQTSRSIEVGKSSNNIIKADMWMVYRDAVVQAGTLPAFQQINSWIQSKKIQEEEAAQVVAALPNTLHYPTKEVMIQFFQLARSAEVRDQLFLNTTALIAATKFINMGQVNNDTAHDFYPTHMFGRLARKHDNFVLEQILPPLAEDLKDAIQRGDSSKAQVYVKAIGNLGHREILKVFAPYLEGQIMVSTYLRTEMVLNLQVLAHQKDRHARAVLFSILRNTAEPYEVRVAAIHIIFMSHPTGAMMQAMAQMTHDDPSIQVRAALQSGIESAAELKNPHYWDLSQAAQAAKQMLSKEKFGYQYSLKKLNDGFNREYELGIFSAVSHIGSEDSLVPKHLKYSIKSKNGGWNKENTISASFSSVQQIIDFFKVAIFGPPNKSQTTHKYSADKISEMLSIKRDPKKPLEASLYIDFINQQRFFTLSEDDLNQLNEYTRNYRKQVEKGTEKHYTKVLNQAQVSIMFPVAMGMPFIYVYKEPTVIHIQGKTKSACIMATKENKNYSVKIEHEIQFTFAKNTDGYVGFMDTLSNQHFSVGVINKFQLYFPAKLNFEMKRGQAKIMLEPIRPDQDNTILHYSVWPFSSIQKKDTLVPGSQDPNTKVFERNKKVVSMDTKFGQTTNTIFHLQGYSYSSDFKNIGSMFESQDFLTNIASIFSQKDVAMTHFNLRYIGKQSQTKAVTLTVAYDELYNQKHGGEMGPASNQQDTNPNSEARRQEMAKRVSSGIRTASARVVDLSATFDGAQKIEYVASAALGDSLVDPKVQYVVFAARNSAQHGNAQVNAVGSINKPEINSLNFLQVLDKDLKTKFEVDIKYGQSGDIHMQGHAQRSQKYTEELQNHPLAKQCAQEIARNNQYQYACYKMIIMAHAPDHLKASVTYKDVSPSYRNVTYQAYKLAEHYGFWYTEVNPLKSTPDGKLEIQVDNSYIDHTFNAAINSRYGDIRMKDIPIPKETAYAFAVYQPFKPYERVANYYTCDQYQPYCSVEGTKIRTFSNRTYDYTLSRSWHVVIQDEYSENGNWHELAVLARKPKENQQEVYVSYKSETGKDLEIEIKPAPEGTEKHEVLVVTNSQKVSEGDLTIYWDEVKEKPLLEYQYQPDGVLLLNIEEDRLRVMYDGQRLVVLAKEYRDTARGICGRMSGEPRDDYLTPEGIVDKPEYYAASYTLNDENSDPQTQELKTKAKQQAYQPKNKYTAILRSDKDWQQARDASSEEDWGSETVYKSRSYNKQKGPCEIKHQVQYYENHGEICISTTKLPACQSHCRGQEYKVQAVQMTCRPKHDQQFRTYREQIKQGQNPEVSGVPKVKQYKVPTSCQA